MYDSLGSENIYEVVCKFSVPAYTTCGVGAQRFGPITAISLIAANIQFLRDDPHKQLCVVRCHPLTDFHQSRNKTQVDSERVVLTDVEEHASDTGKLLIELEVDEFGEPRETSDIVYVI
ncbi:hypothetical protein EVAR_34720_1 [Eumeta japonica]|uniref:Uncharacterized protein n=1 Tax=Eumeta variegata TaxID=151549 RepID=A0A4C1XE69_EUMVA|nr:hypothetical protein EVAR_34720_1 [Eumeta japonica]